MDIYAQSKQARATSSQRTRIYEDEVAVELGSDDVARADRMNEGKFRRLSSRPLRLRMSAFICMISTAGPEVDRDDDACVYALNR